LGKLISLGLHGSLPWLPAETVESGLQGSQIGSGPIARAGRLHLGKCGDIDVWRCRSQAVLASCRNFCLVGVQLGGQHGSEMDGQRYQIGNING
jgi:hypothetical protein